MNKLPLTPEQKRERAREYARKYYQANKTRAKGYYALNKEKIKGRAAAWRIANRERYLIQQAEYDIKRRMLAEGRKRTTRNREEVKNQSIGSEEWYKFTHRSKRLKGP